MEQGAAALSIATGSGSSLEETLVVAVTIIGCMAREMYNPDSLKLAFLQADRLCEGKREVIMSVWKAADNVRRGNPLSGMF